MKRQVATPASGAKNTPMRDRIIAAAMAVIAERGIAAATTKEIARVAGVSEGSLYNHFANKTALIGATMSELAGGLRAAMMALLDRVGEGTVEENLAAVAEAAIDFYRRILPVNGPVLGDPEVLAQIRRDTPEAGVGPLRGHEALTAYFAAEQKAGRVASPARPVFLASALMGACHQYAFLRLMADGAQIEAAGLPADAGEYAREVARLLSQAAVASPG
jgi:AcrR family transcriptional regulator